MQKKDMQKCVREKGISSSQIRRHLEPLQSRHVCLSRWCSQIEDPPHSFPTPSQIRNTDHEQRNEIPNSLLRMPCGGEKNRNTQQGIDVQMHTRFPGAEQQGGGKGREARVRKQNHTHTHTLQRLRRVLCLQILDLKCVWVCCPSQRARCVHVP
jgi:hypothetical protein